MQIQRRQPRRRSNPLLRMLFVMLILAAVSFGLAVVWQKAQASFAPPPSVVSEEPPVVSAPSDSASSELDEAEQSASSSEVSSEEEEELSSSEESSEESETQSTEEQSAPEAKYITGIGAGSTVPASAAVDNSYFGDAVFFGDSISTGIPLYHVMDNAAVFAFTGINTDNISYKPCIETPNGRVTVLQAAQSKGPRSKVYIMLGGNSLAFDKETFISTYKVFLESVIEMYPDAAIYVQSMTPVTRECYRTYPTVNNEKIREYNLAIKQLALSCGVEYLDVAEAMIDENGELPMEASPVDGMHFSPEYYAKWFDYLKTHTVGGK